MTLLSDDRPGMLDRLTARITRRDMFASAGLLGGGALLQRSNILKAAMQEQPALAETLSAAITLEAFAVTYYGVARGRTSNLELEDAVTRFVRAAQCEEEAHFHFFEASGAVPATTSFTISSRQFERQSRFLNAALAIETILVGAHMATARQFAALGDLRLVEIAYQIGAVEAQHQAMLRLFLGERLPSDRAFARWAFRDPQEAVTALAELGFIGGSGDAWSFPGPVDRYCRGVTGLTAEATEDQPPPLDGRPSSPESSPVPRAENTA